MENKNLISAAPDLLKACQMALSLISYDDKGLSELEGVLTGAINKALGKTNFMNGTLIQINNVDGESIGLWYTEENELMKNTGMLVDWFRSYDDSDKYDEEGVDGFDEFVAEMGYKIERVYIEEEYL